MLRKFIFSSLLLSSCVFVFAVSNPTGGAMYSNSSSNYEWGTKITALNTTTILSVTISGGSFPDHVRVYSSSGSLLGSASVVSSVATFSSPVSISSGSDYYVLASSYGGYYSFLFDSSLSFPIVKTDISYIDGIYNTYGSWSPASNILASIIDIETSGSSGSSGGGGTAASTGVGTSTQAIADEEMTYVQLFLLGVFSVMGTYWLARQFI